MIIPKEVKSTVDKLKKAGFEAYIVGGCVRDLLRGADPEDWDIATNAKPEEIGKMFPKNFADNKFGTVTVLTGSKIPKLKEIEITPFRTEEKYTDKRHPDEVKWAKTVEEDLARRDFTVNAIAVDVLTPKLKTIDPFEGQKDLEGKVIRSVGKPEDRFNEDALRLMRAVRLSTLLDFKIEPETAKAIGKNAPWLQAIAKERIREEFVKIVTADKAADGVELLRELGLLKYIAPELLEGYGVSQNKHHIYDCYTHNLLSLKYAAERKFNRDVRIAALFHDVAKPRVKRGTGADATFYGHEIVGAKMTAQILSRLRFARKEIEKIAKLVRYHLFYYNVDEVTESSVRRLVRRVGPENIEELLQVRMCDRIGSGVPKAEPYKLRHLQYIIEKVSKDPISVKTLKVNGGDVMKALKISPGTKIGAILDILLGEVLADPKKNKKTVLMKLVAEVGKMEESGLKKMAEKARKDREDLEVKNDQMTKKKYWVT